MKSEVNCSSGILVKQQRLKKLLDEKKCFKLICGAGNEDLQEVERLVALYAAAGCRFFDLSANLEVIKSAKIGLEKGLETVGKANEIEDCFFCVSTGIKGEPHLNKVKINKKLCRECKKCVKICPQEAISKKFKVKEEKCVGCLRCLNVCKHGAIEVYSKCKPIEEIFEPLFAIQHSPFTCIELHASGEDEEDVKERWDYISDNFDGILSICIDRAKLSNERIISRIKNLIKDRKPYTTIIQADGAPMSGGEDDYKTTLQAVAMAEIIQNADLPVYILLSGGTNSKTAELSKMCGIDFSGISVGSYARKIVKKHIERDDFFENKEVFAQALKIAKKLVETVKNLEI